MSTAKELLGEYIDAELEVDLANSEEDPSLFAQKTDAVQVLRSQIRQKFDNIDHFMIELTRRDNLLVAEIDTLKTEIKRLSNRKSALKRTEDYFKTSLLPMIVEEVGNDKGIFETDTARYKLYETFGPVIVDEAHCPSEFKKVNIIESIDRKKARAFAMDAVKTGKTLPASISIEKVKRVRRT
tara:strand:+ start:1279 stop:1827 length:549 start_codon:yes stop_codon:yes gene_type:complete